MIKTADIPIGRRWHDTESDQVKVWDGEAWQLDYRELLKRYMANVEAREGVYFIEPGWDENPDYDVTPYPGLSDADQIELGKIASEISYYDG